GEAKREFEEQTKVLSGQRSRRRLVGLEQQVIGRRPVVGNQWQRDHTGAREAAKRIGLVGPVHVSWPRGVTPGHVLGALVIGANSRHGLSNVSGQAHGLGSMASGLSLTSGAHTGKAAVDGRTDPGEDRSLPYGC